MRWRAGSDLRGGNEVAQRAKTAFESQTGFFHRLSVESNSGELDEVFSVCVWQINCAGVAITNNSPALPQISRGQAQFGGKDIDSADRQQTKRGRATGKTIYDLVDRAIAARRYNSPVSVPRSFAGERFRLTHARGRMQLCPFGNFFHTRAPLTSTLASRGRI